MPTPLEDLNYFLEQTLETVPRFICEPPYERLRAFIEANTPWLPPQQEGFGPWIEWKPGDLGPRIGDIVRIFRGASRDSRRWARQTFEGPAEEWSWFGSDIVAYCVKLPDAE